LFFATTMNYIDRQVLRLIKPIPRRATSLDKRQFGIVNSVFKAPNRHCLVGFGWFIDEDLGTKIGYAVSIGGVSMAAMATPGRKHAA